MDMRNDIMMKRIRELCKEKGITINDLGKIIGVSQSVVNKWGKTTIPSIDYVAKMAEQFGVSIDYLYGRSNIKSTAENIMNDEKFITLQRACQKMTEEDEDKSINMLKIAFDYAFSD